MINPNTPQPNPSQLEPSISLPVQRGSAQRGSVQPVPHLLDIAPLEQLPDLLSKFWRGHHAEDGVGFTPADLEAADRAHRRLEAYNEMREQREQSVWWGPYPGTIRVLAGMTGIFVGASFRESNVWIAVTAIVVGLVLTLLGVTAAHREAISEPTGGAIAEPAQPENLNLEGLNGGAR